MADFTTLALLIRGTVNPGVIAGTEVATEENEKNNKNISSRGRIIGIVAGVVIIIIVIVIAVCYDRSKKRKARQGTKLREMRGEGDEEARPMVYGQAPVGGQRASMQQPSGTYYPSQPGPQGEHMYAGGGYGQAPPYAPPGQQGAEFYRNQ
ncbi:hypothetical protein N431DRAFT_452834 [Stipitochalara longipes BDJ]|nr:hypothetical protein N431DRAFT_452834 [Stipitochalara longipes BDJ]